MVQKIGVQNRKDSDWQRWWGEYSGRRHLLEESRIIEECGKNSEQRVGYAKKEGKEEKKTCYVQSS